MSIDYYLAQAEKWHPKGEPVMIGPNEVLFIPMDGNVRAIVQTSNPRLEHVVKRPFGEPPALFWLENLSSSTDGTFVFETKYLDPSDEVLPLHRLPQIPENIREQYTKQRSARVQRLAERIVGNETDTIWALRKIYHFVRGNRRKLSPTSGTPVDVLLDQYDHMGYYLGNCKESRDLSIALCNSIGFPAKMVFGKSSDGCYHVWADIFVPTSDGYKLFPLDTTTSTFGRLIPHHHRLFEYGPTFAEHQTVINKVLPIHPSDRPYLLTIE